MTEWVQVVGDTSLRVVAEHGVVRSAVFVDDNDDSGDPDPKVADALERYNDGDRHSFDHLTVDFGVVTPFTADVLRELRRIPFGELRSYGQIADAVGNPRAARAIGRAVGSNPICVIVPCHRVVAFDGTLGGFSGGLDNKRALLAHEGVDGLKGGQESVRYLSSAARGNA